MLFWLSLAVVVQVYKHIHSTQVPQYNAKVQVCGRIASLVRVSRWGQSFHFQTTSVDAHRSVGLWYMYYAEHYPWFQGGEKWCFQAQASVGSYGQRAKIIGSYVKKGSNKFYAFIYHMRRKLAYLLLRCGLSASDQAFFLALCLGIRTQLTTKQWEILQHTGTSHLIAIAGLHIGMVAYGSLKLFNYLLPKITPFKLRLCCPYVSVLLSTSLAIVYALISGLSPPAQRAILMLIVITLSYLLWRKNSAYDSFYIAALLILIFVSPKLSNISFGLSLIAAFSVVYLLSSNISKENNWHKHIVEQIKLTILLTPWICFYFHYTSWVSILCNMIAIPIVTLIIAPLALIGILFLLFYLPLAKVLLKIAAFFLHILWFILHLFGSGQWMLWVHPINSIWLCIIYYIALLFLFSGLPLHIKSIAFVLLLPIFLMQVTRPKFGEFKLLPIKLSKKTIYLLETHKANYLLGIGAVYPNRLDDIHRTILPKLYASGIPNLAGVFIASQNKGEAKALKMWQHHQVNLTVHNIYAKNCSATWLNNGVIFYSHPYNVGRLQRQRKPASVSKANTNPNTPRRKPCNLFIYGTKTKIQAKYQLHSKKWLIYH